MSDITLEQQILDVIRKLDDEKRRKVLEHARNLSRPEGEPGWKLVEHARKIAFPKEDLAEMAQAIEEWCERIDDFPEVDFDD